MSNSTGRAVSAFRTRNLGYFAVKDITFYLDAAISYCNITFFHTHDGRGDLVHVSLFAPDLSASLNRFLATGGGGGLVIQSNTSSVVSIAAVASSTDRKFGNFITQADAYFLLVTGR
ncbi:hypothetical protein P171DRAFT_483334 [Karstenula rhodostoma CBS 690.94]|uniref:Uncharacterized protein n=1 Tax=Karstenula rhodostoma CBS 690.94 TaxID=1392251 RepID=A0A9P4PQ96_9PLEO|nr:hypothetical protein P171DRAFT_483334 [Karstenula rhodostoma CBS 690.94]